MGKKIEQDSQQLYSTHILTMSSQQTVLRAYLPDPDVYQGLQTSYKSEFSDMNYHDFLTMNYTFLSELPKGDITWLTGLCTRIRNCSCKLVDGESYSAFGAQSYYFKKDGTLCIMGGR